MNENWKSEAESHEIMEELLISPLEHSERSFSTRKRTERRAENIYQTNKLYRNTWHKCLHRQRAELRSSSRFGCLCPAFVATPNLRLALRSCCEWSELVDNDDDDGRRGKKLPPIQPEVNRISERKFRSRRRRVHIWILRVHVLLRLLLFFFAFPSFPFARVERRKRMKQLRWLWNALGRLSNGRAPASCV